MKALFLLFLLMISLNGYGQGNRVFFTDPSNYWTSEAGGIECELLTRSFYYDRDTTMMGQQYHHMTHTYSIRGYCSGIAYAFLTEFYIREDSIAGKVYYVRIYPPPMSANSDTAEKVLYDYNLDIGDTMRYEMGFYARTDSVVSIDSISIAGSYHKVITLQGMDPARRAYTVIEGMGTTNDPVFPAYFGGCFEYGTKLTCFWNDSGSPSITVPHHHCNAFQDELNFTNCRLSAPNIENDLDAITLGPNPAIEKITLTTKGNFGNDILIRVYDQTGKKTFSTNLPRQSSLYNISTTSWLPGLYLIIIQNAEGLVKTEKVTILK